ncbi:MAG: hypothetical protein HOE48_21180 [Candidatus Latescibacteria bacterium]|jgi:hypothetical protein|nr:hypothetical protein [Candidatus Latescibacterota bacterium]MBT4140437.1 hypothetical protein [Candidatus Latescibacterota bacterium]MBT5833008.1 hypothetical protein [Candidatus Latescibacterota bacterium]
MDKLKGIATKVAHTTETEEYQTTITKKYFATFFLNNTQITIELDNPTLIEENDEVIVIGDNNGSVFKANAYRNLTKGVPNEHEGWVKIGIGIFMVGAGLYMLHEINYDFENMTFAGTALVSFLFLGGLVWGLVGWSINSSLKDFEEDSISEPVQESDPNDKADNESQKLT